ncbi:uncharacterized protein KRP23_14512 [Phytophthora ramorum]|uniref:uncharacterized protein n=1 Tax=Phytophthora ramorum TaxID=164328 RepID=UPI0030A6D2E7|nr:hypothetical protein KRP23_14512 [Phytophthora ramorum]
MASRTPSAPDTSLGSCDSSPASAASPSSLVAEVEVLTSSDHTCLDTAEESTGHAANKKKLIEKNEKGDGSKKLKSSKKSDEEKEAESQRDLDMLADTVRSIATDVAASSAGDEEAHDEEQNAGEAASPSEAKKPSADTDNSEQATETVGVPVSVSEEVAQGDVTVLPSSGAEGCSEASSNPPARSAPEPEEPKRAPKRHKRCEYPDETRALCVRRHQTDGASYATISKEMGIPHDTVRAIVRKAKRTGTVSSAPRSGRPRKTSGIVDKVILEAVKTNRQCSARSIQEELLRVFGIKISPETVRRRVQDHTKQRIQSISNGASSEGAAIPTTDKSSSVSASDRILDVSEARRPSESTGPSTSLPAVSFQELLHGEGLRSSRPSRSLAPATVPVPGATEPAMISGSSLSTASAVDDGVVPECPPQVQAPHPESEPSKRPKRGEYSIETREQCVALHAQGEGYRKIGKALSMPHTTVRAIVEKAQRTGSVLPAKRTGRPRKTDEIVDKIILQAVKANEKSSARTIKEQLLAAYGVRVSCETIRRRVKDHSRQCMLTTSSPALPDALASNTLLDEQETARGQELLAVAVADRSSAPAASLMTFDENGVHI